MRKLIVVLMSLMLAATCFAQSRGGRSFGGGSVGRGFAGGGYARGFGGGYRGYGGFGYGRLYGGYGLGLGFAHIMEPVIGPDTTRPITLPIELTDIRLILTMRRR